MPTEEVIKQFLIGRVIPPLAAAAATWIVVHLHFLALFHVGQDETAKTIASLGVFAVVYAFQWLHGHYALKGHYLAGKVGTDAVVVDSARVRENT